MSRFAVVTSLLIHIGILLFISKIGEDDEIIIDRVGRVEVNLQVAKERKKDSVEARSKEAVKKEKKVEKPSPKKEKKVEKPKKVIEKPLETKSKKKISVEKIEEKPVEAVVEVEETNAVSDEIVKNKESESKKESKEETNESKAAIDSNIVELADGSLSVKHQGVKGLDYGFISSPDPSYPKQARRSGYKGSYTVKVIMQFGVDGKLETYRFIDVRDKYGFTGEVEKILANWRLTEIRYRGKPIKMRFYKTFKFQVR